MRVCDTKDDAVVGVAPGEHQVSVYSEHTF